MAPAAVEVAHHVGMLQGMQKGSVLCVFSVNIKISNYLNVAAHTAVQLIKHQYQIGHLTKPASTRSAEGGLVAQSLKNFLNFAVFKMSENQWIVNSLKTQSM